MNASTEIEELILLIKEIVEKCTDESLLDLIYKILIRSA